MQGIEVPIGLKDTNKKPKAAREGYVVVISIVP
jgi:hypothetical protein